MKAASPRSRHAVRSEASQPSLKPSSFRIFFPGLILLTSCLLLFCSHKRNNPLDPTLNKAPNAPSNPYPANGATNQGADVTLSWDCSDPNAGDVLTYDVYFGTSNPPSSVVANNQSAKSLHQSGLSYNTTFYWMVVARDNHGAVTSGAVWSFATGAIPNNPPNTPGNPNPPNGATGQLSSLTLSWSGGDPDPGDTAKYDVYFDTSNPPSTRVAQDLVPTSLARTNLNSGTTYYWQIISKDRRGAVTTGPVWMFQTRSLPGAPSLISPMNGSVGVPINPATFVWGRVALLKAPDLPVILPVPSPAPAPVTVSSVVLTGFAALKSANNDGEVSRPVHRLPADRRNVGHSDAQVPALLRPVSLPPSVLAITYQIQVATDTGFVNRVVDQLGLTDTTYSTNVLSLATTYYWRVQTRDSGFIGPWSGRFSFMTDQAPNVPSNPSPPDGAMNQPISLTLSWSGGDPDPGDTARYDIYFDTVNPPVTRVSTGQLGTTLFCGGLNVNTTFYWKIVATDNHGAQVQGAVWRFSTGNPWATRAPMPTARTDFGAAVVNNKIYAIGGNSPVLRTVEEYDPSTNQWTTKASMPTGRNGLAVGVVNNKIYAIGGYNAGYLTTVEEYDPSTDTWTTKSPMPTGRWRLTAGVVNNKIYAIGGENTSGVLSTVEVYDPSTNSWTAESPMPTPRAWLGVGVVANQIYAIGGWQAAGVYLSTVEMYDPASNSWTAKASKPTARGGLRADAVNNIVYAFGGEGGVGEHTEVEAYDPSTDTWTTKTPMPTARCGLGVCTVPLNNKIYAIGGWDGYNPLSVVEEYDPSLDP